jgi:RNA polymerase sigma-70 factor (ECF subfamily)
MEFMPESVETMEDESSAMLVTRWRNGDQKAASELFRRYTNRLISLARSRLSSKVGRRVDPEDVVQSVYRTFFADSRDGRYDIRRGGDLWHLLVTITLHKLNDQVKYNTRAKRAIDREQQFGSEDSLFHIFPQGMTREPTPVEAITLIDQMEQLMRQLDPRERRMFELRLQAHSLEDIAQACECSQRTVIRVLERVKQLLEHLT